MAARLSGCGQPSSVGRVKRTRKLPEHRPELRLRRAVSAAHSKHRVRAAPATRRPRSGLLNLLLWNMNPQVEQQPGSQSDRNNNWQPPAPEWIIEVSGERLPMRRGDLWIHDVVCSDQDNDSVEDVVSHEDKREWYGRCVSVAIAIPCEEHEDKKNRQSD